jgi:SET domain-containing protein
MDLKSDFNMEAAAGEVPPSGNGAACEAPVDFSNSAIHGRGGFARARIPQAARVIEYVGERISKAESLRRCQSNNEYIFTVTETEDLDGNVPWNPARFINHSCEPNCEAILEVDRIWIVALRDIQPGEELTFNYGYDLADYREHPCRCGANNCVGYIVSDQFFDHVRKQQEYARG